MPLRPRHLLAITIALVGPAASAQRPAAAPLPAAGTRVRVSAPPARRVVGTVVAHRGDTLILRRATWYGAETTTVLLPGVHTLEASVGKRRRLLPGALLGLSGGAAAGALVGAATYSDAPSRCSKDGVEVPCFISLDFGRGFNATVGGVLGGAAGLVVGLVAGARQVDRWAAVDLGGRSSRLRLLPPTERSGPGLAVAVGF